MGQEWGKEGITARAKTEGQVRRAVQLGWTFNCMTGVIAITTVLL